MQTLIDPFELATTYVPPPARAPMQTISIDVDLEEVLDDSPRSAFASDVDSSRESWGRVRCWCSED